MHYPVAVFGCSSAGLLRQKSVIHRRGDSFSSLRSDAAEDSGDAEPRPIFFLHGVGLGLVRLQLS